MIAVATGNWIVIGLAGAIALAGFGLAATNLLPLLRRRGTEEAPPLIGKPRQITRRTFWARVLLSGIGAALANFGAVSLGFLWPSAKSGFGGKVTLSMPLREILAQIQATRQPFYFAPGRFYLVAYDDTDPKATIYTRDGVAKGGIMALYQKCVHLGCKVPFCTTSQWFECPCHGSKYNRAGEYKLGPAPRGLDRFPISIENGVVTVDTGTVVTGPPRGTDTTGQEKEGPFCVERVQSTHK